MDTDFDLDAFCPLVLDDEDDKAIKPTPNHVSSKNIPRFLEEILRNTYSEEIYKGKYCGRWKLLGIPDGLPRDEYNEVKRFIEAIRGEWVRAAKAHLFNDDPQELIEFFLDTGKYPEKNPYAYFPTPESVIDTMLLYADLWEYDMYGQISVWKKYDDNWLFLEPEAGDGAIARAIRKIYPQARIHCCEIDPLNRYKLEKQGFEVIGEDFLTANIPDYHYSHILMNPPFSIKGDPNLWVKHYNHALSKLRQANTKYDDIRLVGIAPSSFLGSSNKKIKELRDRVAFQDGSWETLPENSFAASGTKISTVVFSCTSIGMSFVDQSAMIKEISITLQNESEWYRFCSSQSGAIDETTQSPVYREILEFTIKLLERKIEKEDYNVCLDNVIIERLIPEVIAPYMDYLAYEESLN